MHFCTDEALALAAAVPIIGFALRMGLTSLIGLYRQARTRVTQFLNGRD